MNEDVIVGRNPVLEALKAGRAIDKIWIKKGMQQSARPLFHLAKEKDIHIQTVPKPKLDQMAEGGNHQGIVATVAAHHYADMDELFARAEAKEEAPFFILLDGVADPHNLGSMLRTADACGAHGLIVTKHRSVGLTATVGKTSAGAVEYVPVCRVTNLARTIEALKERGMWFAATAGDGDSDYRQVDYQGAIGLVIGSEGSGVSRLVREKSDFLVRLPMEGYVNALNASVAAALFMYEVYRQRDGGGGS